MKILSKIRLKLTENKGSSTIFIGLAKFLLVVFIFYIILVLNTVITLVTNSRALIESATVQTLQNNYINVYHTSRESYSGGYRPTGTGFVARYKDDKSDIINNLTDNDNMILMGDNMVKVSTRNDKFYAIEDINVKVNNELLKSGTEMFTITTKYNFVYFISFFDTQYEIKLPMLVQVKHTGKF